MCPESEHGTQNTDLQEAGGMRCKGTMSQRADSKAYRVFALIDLDVTNEERPRAPPRRIEPTWVSRDGRCLLIDCDSRLATRVAAINQRDNMRDGPKRLKQKSLLGYLDSSSPTQPEASSSRRAPQSSPTRKRRAPAKRGVVVDSDPPSGDDSGSTSSDAGRIGFEPTVIEISSEEDEVRHSPRQPTATQRKARRKRVHSVEGTPAKSSGAEEDEEIGVPVTWKGRPRNVKGKRKLAVLDSDSDNPPPRKSKLIKGARPSTPEEKEEDLLNEVDEERKWARDCFRHLACSLLL